MGVCQIGLHTTGGWPNGASRLLTNPKGASVRCGSVLHCRCAVGQKSNIVLAFGSLKLVGTCPDQNLFVKQLCYKPPPLP